MTFDERVRALALLGFSERQTRFLVTVALHGGFCLRRQYMAFAGLTYGAGVRDFLPRACRQTRLRRPTDGMSAQLLPLSPRSSRIAASQSWIVASCRSTGPTA